VDDEDPKRAADLANAYVDELFKLTTVLAVTEASQRRLFFERQLDLTRVSLVKAETEARRALEQGGLAAVDSQGRSAVETAARLRAQISVKEVQIGAMRTFASEGNPELKLAQREIEVMKQELAKSEGATGSKTVQAVAGRSSGIDNLGLLRNVKYYETMYGLLAQQFESAKIDEAKDSAIIQVMDKAIEPDRKSKPRRSLIVLLSALIAGLLAVVLIFPLEAMEKSNQDPRNVGRWQILKRHLALRAWWPKRRL
jgi:tyrosine-protein kinase Etk/Wzc